MVEPCRRAAQLRHCPYTKFWISRRYHGTELFFRASNRLSVPQTCPVLVASETVKSVWEAFEKRDWWRSIKDFLGTLSYAWHIGLGTTQVVALKAFLNDGHFLHSSAASMRRSDTYPEKMNSLEISSVTNGKIVCFYQFSYGMLASL